MKKTIFLLLAAVLLLCASAGCIAEEETEEKVSSDIYVLHDESAHHIFIYVDGYTGVEYLIYDGYQSGGVCPRYNTDGTLKINEGFKDAYNLKGGLV